MFNICRVCNQKKPVTQFYGSDRKKCKACVCASVRANRQTKADYYRAKDRERNDDPKRVAARRAYKSSPEAKAVYVDRYTSKNPEKRAAHNAVGNAVRSGRLIPQPCERCSYGIGVHAHHEDYGKPLDVTWLCQICHGERHREINEERRRSAA